MRFRRNIRLVRRLVATVTLALGLCAVAHAQSAVDAFDPGSNGQVFAVAVQPDGKIIVGGSFTTFGGGGSGTTMRNRIARLNADGSLDSGFNPGANEQVNALAVQADGKILVAGYFTMLGGGGTGTTLRYGIGRLNADGSLDTTFDPGAFIVLAVAVQPDGKIVVGGIFTALGGGGRGTTPRSNIGRLQADGSLDASFNPGANDVVSALAVQPDGRILVGGAFTMLGGGGTGTTPRNRMARLNADGSVDPGFDPGANGEVKAAALQPDGKILFGGRFTMFGGGGSGTTPRSRIGRLNSDGSLDPAFDPGANGQVSTEVVQPDGKILVGGYFTMLGGGGTGTTARFAVGRLNVDGSLDLNFNPGANNIIYALAVQPDSRILVGGAFTTLGGGGTGTTTRNSLGRLNADGSLEDTFNPGANDIVNALALQPDGKILVGGSFTMLGGGGTGTTTRNRIGRLNADGSLDTSFNPGANGDVTALAVLPDGRALVGGGFTTLGGGSGTTTRNHIGRLNADGSLDPGFDPGANSGVVAIAVQADGKILLAGYFTMLGGGGTGTTIRNRIGRLNADGSLDASFNPGANGDVYALAVQADGKILVGGSFTMLGGGGTGTTSRNHLGRLNADGSLDTSFNPGADDDVDALAVQADGKILAGGYFTRLGGGGSGTTTRYHLGRLDADGSLEAGFNPGADLFVDTIALQADGKILVGGGFTALGGGTGTTTRNRLGRLNADGSVDSSFGPGASTPGYVAGVAVQPDGKIVVGGLFTMLGSDVAPRTNIGRLTATNAATQRLSVTGGGSVVSWARSGAGPDVWRVTFESSSDGATYTSLGNATRVAGGWQLVGQSLPSRQNLFIRARGYYETGDRNGSGSIVESIRTFFILPTLTLAPSTVSFGVVNSAGTLSVATPAQTLALTQSGAGSVTWSVAADRSWITVNPTSGSGSATLSVSINNAGGVLPASGSLTGTIMVTATGAGNAPTATVKLEVRAPGQPTASPFGSFDTPAAGSIGLQGSIAVTGWALDDIGIDRVEIWRDAVPGETTPVYTGPGPGNGKIFIATPLFVSGARPDVEAAYPAFPFASRAGWGYLMLTWGLWNQGNSNFTFHAFAFDMEGKSTTLGTKTVTVSNAQATRPFGSIDTPTYGQTVTGSFWNYGWALTPTATPTCTITDGNVFVAIDSGPLTPVSYGALRTDIASAFSGFSNGSNAGGAYYIDTSTVASGVHQIGWLVTDSCGRTDGIGSRFFNVFNVAQDFSPATVADVAQDFSPATVADVHARRNLGAWETVEPAANGLRIVELKEMERLELRLPESSGVYRGGQVLNGTTRSLPIGSTLDAQKGIFYWQPGPGFVGSYDLEFAPTDVGRVFRPASEPGPKGPGLRTIGVRVVVGPPVRMAVDTPVAGPLAASQPLLVAGWALDLASRDGSGIDAVHVWAHPVGGGEPVFLGIANVGGTRPDVAAIYGDQFGGSPYSLVASPPRSGVYDIVVYAHRAVTNAFDAAQAVRVVVP